MGSGGEFTGVLGSFMAGRMECVIKAAGQLRVDAGFSLTKVDLNFSGLEAGYFGLPYSTDSNFRAFAVDLRGLILSSSSRL